VSSLFSAERQSSFRLVDHLDPRPVRPDSVAGRGMASGNGQPPMPPTPGEPPDEPDAPPPLQEPPLPIPVPPTPEPPPMTVTG